MTSLCAYEFYYQPSPPPTALHLAAQSGSSGCVRALLAIGADPNLVDNIQQTPLFPAVEGGHSKCIEAVSLKKTSGLFINLIWSPINKIKYSSLFM